MSDPVPPQKKRRGCFFYGCITSLVVALVLVLVVVFGVSRVVSYVNAQIVLYTDTAPATLPKSDLGSNELAQLEARVSAFGKALDAHTNALPLTFNTAELNAFLADTAPVKNLKLNDRFYVTLQGDQIKAQVSLPLGEYFKIPMIKTEGRYLNGDASLGAVLTNTQLSLTIKTVDVKGKPLPDDLVTRFRDITAATMTNINDNPTNRAYFDHIESAEVKDGILTIKAKP